MFHHIIIVVIIVIVIVSFFSPSGETATSLRVGSLSLLV